MECTLKILNFAGTKCHDFHDFPPFLLNLVPAKSFKTRKSWNQIPAKLIPADFDNFFFPNMWSKYDIDTHISHISAYSNEIRVSVTCLILFTFINNRKIVIQ